MEFIQQRWSSDLEQTFGILRDTGKLFKCHVLEDEFREVKVSGETRIPAERYELRIQEALTPLTIKHIEAYNKGYETPWFERHIEITGIKNFAGVYYHAGNDQLHTDGCPLLGNILDVTKSKNPLTDSTAAVKRFYDLVYPKLKGGERCFVTIKDEISLF